jgi:hypothetical protein
VRRINMPIEGIVIIGVLITILIALLYKPAKKIAELEKRYRRDDDWAMQQKWTFAPNGK